MTAVGGSIESVSIAGRTFSVAADTESQRKLGGTENEIQPNGDGSARNVKTRVNWSIDGLSLTVDDDRGDHEFLQERADASGFEPMSVTYASGVTYQGRGTITGELQVSSQNATASVTLGGPGKLTKQ